MPTSPPVSAQVFGPGTKFAVEDVRAQLREMEDGVLAGLRDGNEAAKLILAAKLCLARGGAEQHRFSVAPDSFAVELEMETFLLFLRYERTHAGWL